MSDDDGRSNETKAASGLGDGAPRNATLESHAPPRGEPGPGKRLGRFRLDRVIGEGGMGIVYEAFDTVLERRVALKLLYANTGDPWRAATRVLREARAAAALQHPNAVSVYEVGDVEGMPYIAMELLRGHPLRTALDQGGVSRERKMLWLLHAARALLSAHEGGLVHRDVKPENMFVCDDDTLKLLDFGIAKRDDADEAPSSDSGAPLGPSSLRTAAGRIIGTPRYMSPEQRAGLSVDGRSDQYSWGLVAFEVLTGLHSSDVMATVSQDGDDTAPASRTNLVRAHAEIIEPLGGALARTLAESPADRFDSMSTIVELLEEMLTDRREWDVSVRSARRLSPEFTAAGAPVAPSTVYPSKSPAGMAPRSPWTARLAKIAIAAVAASLVGAWLYSRPRTRADLERSTGGSEVAAPSCTTNGVAAEDVSGTAPDTFSMAATEGGAWLVGATAGPSTDLARTILGGPGPLKPDAFEMLRGKVDLLGHVSLVGAASFGKEAAVVVYKDVTPALLIATEALHPMSIRRIAVVGNGYAVAGRGEEVFAVVTGTPFDIRARNNVLSKGVVRLFQLAGGSAIDVPLHGDELVGHPAIALGPASIAVAFTGERRVAVAFAGPEGERLGPLHEVARGLVGPPSVVVVDRTTYVVWTERAAAEAPLRMRGAILKPGAATFEPAVDLGPDNVLEAAPALAVHRGKVVVAWTKVLGSGSRVLIARLDENLVLGGALTIADSGGTPMPRMAANQNRIWVSWTDGARVHVQTATCQ